MGRTEQSVRHMRERRERRSDLEDEALPIVRALRDGDLKPLAEYLTAGGLKSSPEEVVSIPQWLALEIVAMIEKQPWCWFSLEIKGRHQNEQGWTRELELEKRDFIIGFSVERQKRQGGRGAYEGAIQDAMARFGATRPKVQRAHRVVKDWLADHTKARLAYESREDADAHLIEILEWHYERDLREARGQSHE